MKKFFQYLLLIVLFSLWGIMLTNRDQTRETVQEVRMVAQRKLGIDQPCSKPLEYAIGNIDPKFGIAQSEFTQLVAQAAEVWNKADGKTLLAYNPAASFKINLVYDNRQEQSNASVQLEQNLQSLEATNNSLTQQYNSLSVDYRKKIDTYNKDVADYKNDLDKYNAEVSYWNSQGGASSDVYNKLKKEKSALDDEYGKIKQEGVVVNTLANQANGVTKKENQVAANYNNSLSTYKSQYGDAQEFEKGVFDGQEINIYQFKAVADLRLTLVHELGHYLGMQHVQNSKSIMYYLIGDQDMNNLMLTAEDNHELNKICKLN